MKKLLSIATLGLALGVSLFSGNTNQTLLASAEETYVSVYTNPCASVSVTPAVIYESYVNVSNVDGVDWHLQAAVKYSDGWRIGGKNTTGEDLSLDRVWNVVTPISESVDRINLTTGAPSDNTISVSSITLSVYSTYNDGTYSNQIGESITLACSKNSVITFDRPSESTWENVYYQFTYKVELTSAATANKYYKITNIDFLQVAKGDSVNFDVETLDLKVNEETTLTAKSVTGNVAWTVEPNDVVSLTASGELNEIATLRGLKAGNATITATVGTASAVCTVSVTELVNNFVRVTKLSDLKAGDKFALVFEESNKVAATYEGSDKYMYCADLVNGTINDYFPLFIDAGYDENTYSIKLESGYI